MDWQCKHMCSVEGRAEREERAEARLLEAGTAGNGTSHEARRHVGR